MLYLLFCCIARSHRVLICAAQVAGDEAEGARVLATRVNYVASWERARSSLASERVAHDDRGILMIMSSLLIDHLGQIKRFSAVISARAFLTFTGPNFAYIYVVYATS